MSLPIHFYANKDVQYDGWIPGGSPAERRKYDESLHGGHVLAANENYTEWFFSPNGTDFIRLDAEMVGPLGKPKAVDVKYPTKDGRKPGWQRLDLSNGHPVVVDTTKYGDDSGDYTRVTTWDFEPVEPPGVYRTVSEVADVWVPDHVISSPSGRVVCLASRQYGGLRTLGDPAFQRAFAGDVDSLTEISGAPVIDSQLGIAYQLEDGELMYLAFPKDDAWAGDVEWLQQECEKYGLDSATSSFAGEPAAIHPGSSFVAAFDRGEVRLQPRDTLPPEEWPTNPQYKRAAAAERTGLLLAPSEQSEFRGFTSGSGFFSHGSAGTPPPSPY